jgi:16S rRNA (guanine(966)-N(2))-methyltransferase RsmD
MMRIITGKARGVRLASLEGEATRPTAERVKEAIFSSIQFEIEGRAVLDLFGGSGQLGLEALSRGAASAMFIDSSADAMAIIKENAKKTGFFESSRFLISDYRSYLRKAAGRDGYHLIFIDPPYAAELVGDALSRILAAGLAKPGCLVVCESGSPDIFKGYEGIASRFEVVKSQRYGVAHVNILRLLPESEASDA